MVCDVWSEKIDAYVDGELGSKDAREFAAHLRQCANCAAAALERVQMKRSVAIAGKNYVASSDLREKVRNRIAVKQQTPRTSMWRILAVPALLVLVLLLGVNWIVLREKTRGKAQREQVYSELADLHVATLASASPVDVVSTDRHTVKPWFEGKIPFTFNLPELQGTDFTLVGGRVAYLMQAPGAQLIYRLRKHEVSVFIFQDRGRDASLPTGPSRAVSFETESWTKNGLQYFVVGDMNAGDIDALAKLFRDPG
jgi:anti-sigma factor RsiW